MYAKERVEAKNRINYHHPNDLPLTSARDFFNYHHKFFNTHSLVLLFLLPSVCGDLPPKAAARDLVFHRRFWHSKKRRGNVRNGMTDF